MLPTFCRVVTCGCWPVFSANCSARQPECVEPHGVQHVVAGHPQEPGVDVSRDVADRVSDVDSRTAGVREHVQHVELRPAGYESGGQRAGRVRRVEGPGGSPPVLPAQFDLACDRGRVPERRHCTGVVPTGVVRSPLHRCGRRLRRHGRLPAWRCFRHLLAHGFVASRVALIREIKKPLTVSMRGGRADLLRQCGQLRRRLRNDLTRSGYPGLPHGRDVLSAWASLGSWVVVERSPTREPQQSHECCGSSDMSCTTAVVPWPTFAPRGHQGDLTSMAAAAGCRPWLGQVAAVASASGRTATAPASRSAMAATVMVQPVSTMSSTRSTG